MRPKIIHQSETRFGPVWVQQQKDILQLKFDKLAIQSEINTRQPQELRMKNLQYLMGVLFFIPPPRSILLLGVGGGSLIHFVRHYLPQTHITGVEYDDELMDIVQTHLLLPPAGDFIDYHITDARDYIATCQHHYDLIIVDVFDADQSPKWLLQSDVTRQLKNLLTARGAIGYNLLIDNEKEFTNFDRLLSKSFRQQTLYMETEEYENILFYALNFKSKVKSMTEYMEIGLQLQQIYALPFNEIMATAYSMNATGEGLL
jgi:spermidine synthase